MQPSDLLNKVALATSDLALSKTLQLPFATNHSDAHPLLLIRDNTDRLALHLQGHRPFGIDWSLDMLQKTKRLSRKQLLARAVGFKPNTTPHVIDATGGFGMDAFTLAALGAKIEVWERSAVIAALLENARIRTTASIDLKVEHTDSRTSLEALSPKTYPDVIYLDPMYPDANPRAQNRLPMRLLRACVGDDHDANALFDVACLRAKKRVVVKRPKGAPHLSEQTPSHIYTGKAVRFDVYFFHRG